MVTYRAIAKDGVLHIVDADGNIIEDGQEFEVVPVEQSASTRGERVLGRFTGSFYMSEDFDAELPDSFWFGEDE